uniref:aspartate transaminase n=1 Tax=Phascolarctos cinereus TaxID=38626 RepID=A0A6P5K991_PHACI|nr:putative aspartate aminotransferase, cytoplasmic 2 isoform X2 [Phascolarctos cinereus]
MPTLSVFLDVPLAPKTVGKLLDDFQKDDNPNKVYLAYEVCMTVNEVPWLPPVVPKTLMKLAHDPSHSYEYLPEHGLEAFIRVATELLVGQHSPAIVENREMGFIIREYAFWDPYRLASDTGKLFDVVEHAPERSIVVLYNPGSFILPRKKWTKLAKVMKRKQIFLFFDVLDQGFISGDPDRDNKILRYFVTQGFEFFCSQCFSSSFGLYDECIGNLIVVALSNKALLHIRSQLDSYARYMWCSPPALGSRVITTILSNPALRREWKKSLRGVVENIMLTREKVKEKLRLLGTPGSWEHITEQDGMHSFLGISVDQVDYLVTKKHIYIPKTGQFNLTCINNQNIDYIAQSINEAILAIGLGPQPREPPTTDSVVLEDSELHIPGLKGEGTKFSGLAALLRSKK